MKTATILSASLFAVSMIGGLSSAQADSSQASCEVFKHGEQKGGASGPCTFSQRQGFIEIALKNGNTYSLSPGDQADHFKDQKGNKVVRKQAGGDTQEFKWDGGRKVVVHFGGSAGAGSASSSARAGDTASGLADLVGARAGQGEQELRRRGYVYSRGSTSGETKYSSWFNESENRCVMIRTEDGRYRSIVSTPLADCGR